MHLYSSNIVYKKNFPLDKIKDDDSKSVPPSPQMIESIQKFGVLQPIILYGTERDCRIIIGRRRLAASKKLGLETIPALIYPEDWNPQEIIALVENHQRKTNLLNDLHNVEKLLEKGWTENKIRSFTGISSQSFKKLLSISKNLINPFRVAMDSNLISVSVACEISKKSKKIQEDLLIKMIDEEKLSMKDVREVCKVHRKNKVEMLPKSLFENAQDDWKEATKKKIEEIKKITEKNASEEVKEMLEKILSLV